MANDLESPSDLDALIEESIQEALAGCSKSAAQLASERAEELRLEQVFDSALKLLSSRMESCGRSVFQPDFSWAGADAQAMAEWARFGSASRSRDDIIH